METIDVVEDLTGKNLEILLMYVIQMCDNFSLARNYRGKLSKEQFDSIKLEYETYYHEHVQRYMHQYKVNYKGLADELHHVYKTETEVKNYFHNYLEEGLECYSQLNFLEFNEYQSDGYQVFESKQKEYRYTKITPISPVTVGPAQEITYYSFGNTLRNLILNMKHLFQPIYIVEENMFHDLTFYTGERVILAICAHERFALLYLEEKEMDELVQKGIALA